METQSTNKTWWSILSTPILPILIALVFLAFTFSYYPFREKLQYDADEGLNLMRSMLVSLGHPLYGEVSSDQPPLFNQILGLLFRVVGFEVNPARLLVLLFSTLLVWACVQFLQLIWGNVAAILFLPLVIMMPEYLRLSTSVMIGVPSIAMAAVSMLFVTKWDQKKNPWWLALSGFALALSVLIKLFTGFLALVFLVGIMASAYFDKREGGFSWKLFQPALIWLLCFGGLGLVLGLVLVGPENVWSIISPHLAAPVTESLEGDRYTINAHLQAAIPLLLLSLFGVAFTIFRRNWLSLYPLAWAGLAYVLFSFYSPVFYHHQLLITIPAAMLAAAGVGEGMLSLVRLRGPSELIRFQTIFGAGAFITFVLVSAHYVPIIGRELLDSPRISGFSLRTTPWRLRVIRTMNEYADRTHWIVTDTPMYAFRVQRPVPPILATFSAKRLATGSLTEEAILTAMQDYRPEQVLMSRFTIPALETYLQENYTLILTEEFFRLFIRNDLDPVIK